MTLNDSMAHRRFSDELVAMDQKAEVLGQMDIPWLRQTVDIELDTLCADPPASLENVRPRTTPRQTQTPRV
jgi:hypothetical protein